MELVIDKVKGLWKQKAVRIAVGGILISGMAYEVYTYIKLVIMHLSLPIF